MALFDETCTCSASRKNPETQHPHSFMLPTVATLGNLQDETWAIKNEEETPKKETTFMLTSWCSKDPENLDKQE